jgi:hypothetical protein
MQGLSTPEPTTDVPTTTDMLCRRQPNPVHRVKSAGSRRRRALPAGGGRRALSSAEPLPSSAQDEAMPAMEARLGRIA